MSVLVLSDALSNQSLSVCKQVVSCIVSLVYW